MGQRENQNRRLLSLAYRNDTNKVKISSANTFTHELLKMKVCYILLQKKHEFVTEAIFENGGRADVFDLTNGVVYEILHTESEEYFNSKKYRYPNEIKEIIPIRTKEIINNIALSDVFVDEILQRKILE